MSGTCQVLVEVGETHFANSQVVAPLCCCMDLQASAALDYRDDFVDAGAVAIPLRVFDQAQVHSAEACAKAAALLKELLSLGLAAVSWSDFLSDLDGFSGIV